MVLFIAFCEEFEIYCIGLSRMERAKSIYRFITIRYKLGGIQSKLKM